ncbi:DUF6457 domain-containing protein [Pseudoclavibacter endophyticus]|nr:DUF6457 domain-containing protein [Pseudoclavibacter endophyticus]
MPPELEPWISELAPRLGLTGDDVPTQAVLDIARDVAHGAVRPGAPVSTFMVGLALGRGDLGSPEAGVEAVGEALAAWEQRAQGDGNGSDRNGGKDSERDATSAESSASDAERGVAYDEAGVAEGETRIADGKADAGDTASAGITDGRTEAGGGDRGDVEEADAAGVVGDLDGGAA